MNWKRRIERDVNPPHLSPIPKGKIAMSDAVVIALIVAITQLAIALISLITSLMNRKIVKGIRQEQIDRKETENDVH